MRSPSGDTMTSCFSAHTFRNAPGTCSSRVVRLRYGQNMPLSNFCCVPKPSCTQRKNSALKLCTDFAVLTVLGPTADFAQHLCLCDHRVCPAYSTSLVASPATTNKRGWRLESASLHLGCAGDRSPLHICMWCGSGPTCRFPSLTLFLATGGAS